MKIDGPSGPVLLAPVWTEEKWAALTDEQRDFVYRCHTDFAYYLYHVFLPYHSQLEGEAYPPGLPWHLSEFARDIQDCLPPHILPFNKPNPRENIVCYILPTGFGKSMTCYALCAWLIGVNRNVSILAASASSETAALTVEAVKRHISHNPRHVDVFGPARLPGSSGMWQRKKFVVERPVNRHTPTMFAAGAEGEIEGWRFDVAVLDDVTTARNSATPHMRSAVKNWVNKVVWARLHPNRRVMIVVGTMHHGADYLADLRQRGMANVEGIRFRQYPAILRGQWPPAKLDPSAPYSLDNVSFDPELELLWPEFWTAERLFEDWMNDPAAFALTRQHRVLAPDDALFPEVVLHSMCRADGEVNSSGVRKPKLGIWHPERSREENLAALYARGVQVVRTVLAIDPAATAARGGTDPDYTACELWARSSDGAMILLWLDRFRLGDPREVKRRLAWIVTSLQPDEVIYEAQAIERFFAADVSAELGVPIRTRGLHGTKQSEIQSLAGYAVSGMLLYAWGDEQARAMMSVFEEELLEYPRGRHDDTVAAALHALHVLREGQPRTVEAAPIAAAADEDRPMADEPPRPIESRPHGRFAHAFPPRLFRVMERRL